MFSFDPVVFIPFSAIVILLSRFFLFVTFCHLLHVFYRYTLSCTVVIIAYTLVIHNHVHPPQLLLLLSFMFVIIHMFISCYVIHYQTIDNMFLLYYLVYTMFYNVIGILLNITNNF